MALINEISHQSLQSISRHTNVDCTYTIVQIDGQKMLQLDTYGSAGREIPGKKSQSLRLTQQAIQQLKAIIQQNGL